MGVYLGNILYTKYMFYQAEQAITAFTQGIQVQNAQAQQRMIQVEQERTRQKQLEINFQREQIARAEAEEQAAQEATRNKDAAWQKFYKRPAKCEDLSNSQVMVECGNYYMKEKMRFEGIWASNQK